MTTTTEPTVDPGYLMCLQLVRRILEQVADSITAEVEETLDHLHGLDRRPKADTDQEGHHDG